MSDSKIFQKIQDYFCLANGIYLLCLTKKDGVMTEACHCKAEWKSMLALIGEDKYENLLLRLSDCRVENLIDEPLDKDYLRLYFSRQSHESFVVLFLDVGNKLIACTEMFRGTLSHTSVYPREVVKAALACNAASVIFAHNHPSGTVKPSQADKTLTHLLRQALGLVDIRVLDHVIVAGNETFSFAEHGLM